MLDPVPLSIKKLKKKIALFFYQKNILKFSDYILVNSKLEKKNIRRLKKNKRIIVIPHAVDNYNIKKKKNKKKIKLVYFSRIHPIKNLKKLIEIFTCRKEFSKYNLDIIGNIEDKKYFFEIQSIIKNFNYINVKKIKKNKYKMLEKYDVLIHPSKSENFGIVILEALLSGLYIIAGKNIPFNSLKKNGLGKNIIFNKNNLNKSLIQFQKLFFNSNQYKLKLHYNNYVKNNFSWKIITKKYINFYTLVSK